MKNTQHFVLRRDERRDRAERIGDGGAVVVAVTTGIRGVGDGGVVRSDIGATLETPERTKTLLGLVGASDHRGRPTVAIQASPGV